MVDEVVVGAGGCGVEQVDPVDASRAPFSEPVGYLLAGADEPKVHCDVPGNDAHRSCPALGHDAEDPPDCALQRPPDPQLADWCVRVLVPRSIPSRMTPSPSVTSVQLSRWVYAKWKLSVMAVNAAAMP